MAGGGLSRSLVGRAPNFRTTQKALAGAAQVQAGYDRTGGVQPQNLSSGPPRVARGGRAGAPSIPTTTPMPSASGTRLGHLGEQVGNFYEDQPSVREFFGSVPDFFTGAYGDATDRLQASDDRVRRADAILSVGAGDWSTPDHLSDPYSGGGGRGKNFERGAAGAVRRAAAASGTVEGASRDEIMGAVQSAYAQFEQDAAKWRTLREQALADGEAETAAQYDRQLRNIEQDMDDLKREIQVAGDVESWYRKIVEAPYIAAREAAANVNFQPTLDLKGNAVSRIDEEYFGVNERLDSVLADIGFTPDQRDALKLGAAEDNAVAAAQMEVLDATAMRPGMLQAKKSLMFHTADQLRLGELRKSAGNELVEVEPRKRALARAAEDMNFLTKEKADAIARTRRAVERSYGDGPLMPTRDEIVETAMDTMMESLGADLPPGQRQAYLDGAWALINSGITEISGDTLYNAFKSGALRPDAATSDALRALYERSEDMTEAQYFAEERKIIDGMFDDEDKTVFASLLDTYQTAWRESEVILNERASNYSASAAVANTDPKNIAAAKAGEGPYGERVRLTNQYAQFFKDMGIRVQGQNYFRPYDADPAEGRAVNSDHLTAGALDLFFDYNNKDDMAFYNQRVRPILEDMVQKGILRQVLHPGTNKAHMDHAHISFSLGEGDALYSTAGHFSGDGHDHSQDAAGQVGAAR